MSNSQLTEKALADALKELMITRSINKITVKEVTDVCGVTRRTFYNHFNDTYELLGWIYEHEVIEELDKYYNLNEWRKAMKIILQYTIENKEICINTFNSLVREYLEGFLYNIFSKVLKSIVNVITKDMNVDESIKEESIRFYTLAVVEEFILWLKNDLKENPDLILDRVDRMVKEPLYNIMKRNDKSRDLINIKTAQ